MRFRDISRCFSFYTRCACSVCVCLLPGALCLACVKNVLSFGFVSSSGITHLRWLLVLFSRGGSPRGNRLTRLVRCCPLSGFSPGGFLGEKVFCLAVFLVNLLSLVGFFPGVSWRIVRSNLCRWGFLPMDSNQLSKPAGYPNVWPGVKLCVSR